MACGINEDRPKLHALVKQKDWDVLWLKPKDRLTRFGFRGFEVLGSFRIGVINLAED